MRIDDHVARLKIRACGEERGRFFARNYRIVPIMLVTGITLLRYQEDL